MPHIQVLDSHVAELISAGEVVERPASVVKELVENAIDAHSTAVSVSITRGGMASIRVSDNGCGVSPDELPSAFLRHATSKVRSADDLTQIGTLGFRGEALAAICAVSRVEIRSRVPGSPTGASLRVEGGVFGDVEETGTPEGTVITVRDLFWNTPARLKFMRKDSAETAAIHSLMQHLALSRPDVSFRFDKDDASAFQTPGDGKLLSAVYAVYGRDFARSLIPVEGRGADITVSGYVTAPAFGRGSRAMQAFFLNGRFIKSQLLTAALEEAYQNQMLKGKFPGCVLSLTMPTREVDVNVHPAKTEVKFSRERDVFHAVYHTVLDELTSKGGPVKLDAPSLTQKSASPDGGFFRTMDAQTYRAEAAYAPAQSTRTTVNRFADAEPVRTRTPEPPPVTPQPEPPSQTELSGRDEPRQDAPWRIVGELFATYIVCESASGEAYLIDKHAAHERVRFDRLKAADAPPMRQTLIKPVAVELSNEDAALALEQSETLERLGFLCEDFGGATLLVREIPADMDPGDLTATLEQLMKDVREGRSTEERRDAMYRTVACKAAVKGGDVSAPKELRTLVDKVQREEVRYCPHGRPVAVKMTRNEVEKLFKR